MYSKLYIEVSGVCNAHCPWCVTGIRSNGKTDEPFLSADRFEEVLLRLIDQKLINARAVISLYNWGEPYLNPELFEIIRRAGKLGFFCALSTNGAFLRPFESDLLSTVRSVTFSLPGFSSASSRRIHGLNFEQVLKNIEDCIASLKQVPNAVVPLMAYHVYQFNLAEIPLAAEFCAKRRINFCPSAAYFNNYYHSSAFRNDAMAAEVLKRAAADLMLDYVGQLIAERPADYRCPQLGYLTIDESCKILTCCGVPRTHPDYTVGSVFDLTREQVLAARPRQAICRECGRLGVDYWLHHPYTHKAVMILSRVRQDAPSPGLREFINTIVRHLRSQQVETAVEYYNRYRPTLANSPELPQLDAEMSRILSRSE